MDIKDVAQIRSPEIMSLGTLIMSFLPVRKSERRAEQGDNKTIILLVQSIDGAGTMTHTAERRADLL